MNNEMHICLLMKCINGHSPSYMNDLLVINSDINGRNTGFIPFFGQKIQGIFKDTFPIFSRTPFSAKKSLSPSFLVLSQHEQIYPEGLPVFAPFRHMRMVRANPGNSQNSSLNLVCPRFKRETEGARTFSVWAAGLWKKIPISFKKIECVHSFKKPLIDFYASS